MILVTDDDPSVLVEIQELLAGCGYQFLLALNGAYALELARLAHPRVRLAMVDLDLPDISGFQLIQDLRAICPGIRIIAFSGVFQDYTLEVARYLGAQAILRKPPAQNWIAVVRDVYGDRAMDAGA